MCGCDPKATQGIGSNFMAEYTLRDKDVGEGGGIEL